MKVADLVKRKSVFWTAVFIVWCLIAFFFSCQIYFSSLLSEKPADLYEIAVIEFAWCLLWATVTPLVVWLARRYQLGKAWRGSLPIHLLASVTLVVVLSAIHYNIVYLAFMNKSKSAYKPVYMMRNAIFNFSEGMAPYWLMVLMINALAFYHRYQHAQLTASRLQAEVATAQLQALKMQLQPHFLFNTLHSISALMYRDINAADAMMARLGDLLRLTLDNAGQQEVSMRQELEFLTCYLEIERTRFQDRLTINIDVEPAALEARVPNLILQPIVENAIRHGIAPQAAAGHIELIARLEHPSADFRLTNTTNREPVSQVLRIAIKDNGRGWQANPNAATRLTNILPAHIADPVQIPYQLNAEGVGLTNTRARLAQFYGTAQCLNISDNQPHGVVVTLWIPQSVAAVAPLAQNHSSHFIRHPERTATDFFPEVFSDESRPINQVDYR